MSRTRKDRPAWVVNHKHGVIDHDHRTGVCRVETLADAARPRARSHWRAGCAKVEMLVYTCTKADPHRDDPRWGVDPDRECWRAWVEPVRDSAGVIVDAVWRSTQCLGHTRRVYHPDWPCSCDETDTITCTPAWRFGDHYDVVTPPKWFRDHVFTNPERRRTRDQLRDAARLYNGGDDLDGFDFVNRQSRGSARWLWE